MALCADLLALEGHTGILGGSQHGEEIQPGGSLARIPMRLLAWLTKAEHIRDATPFPRTINRAYP